MDCPSDEQLRTYLAAPTRGSAELREHLRTCSKCRSRIGGLDDTQPRAQKFSDSAELARGSSIGRFVVLHELGRGGMGVVFAAYDPILERKVALKLLRFDNLPEDHVAGAKSRLLREAKAAARLSHPNVVTVFEALVHGDGEICVAMEFVEGETLKSWQKTEPRDWRDVLKKYAEAALGLGAAHEAGIVHRDFKPANVLVGKDGRVRVADFGLARAQGASRLLEEISDSGVTLDSVHSSDQLTRPGALVGTPAYMAPEQIGGQDADERSDQFSFGVALYEALAGERPFRGETLGDVLKLMQRAPPPMDRIKGPRRLKKALLRALAYDRSQRFSTMAELARELSSISRQRRAQRMVQAGAAALLVAGLGAVALRAPSVRCDVKGAEIDATWSSGRRSALFAAWKKGGGAADELERPLKLIDRYADAWRAASAAACDGALVKKVHSTALYDRQTACLGQLRRELDATLNVLGRTQAKDVPKAIEAVAALSPLGRCGAEEVAGRASFAVPKGKEMEVDDLRASLAALKAQRLFDASGALTDGEELLKKTEALGFLPLHAEALEVVGQLHSETQQLDAAQQVLERALATADRAGYDELRLRAETHLAGLLGFRNTRFKEAHYFLDRATALLERLGRPAELETDLTTTYGMIVFNETHYDEAHAKFVRALELTTQLVGQDHPRSARARANLAQALKGKGAFAEAEQMASAAAKALIESAGPDHRWTRVARYSLATIYLRSGRGAEALSEFRAAQPEVKEGEVTLENAALQIRLALAHAMADELEQAQKILDAVDAFWVTTPPQDSTSRLDLLFARAEVLYGQGKLEEAEKRLVERATALEQLRGVWSFGVAEAWIRVARVQLDRDALDDAQTSLNRAQRGTDSSVKPDDLLASEHLSYKGELLALRGGCGKSRELTTRALAGLLGREPDPSRIARARMAVLLCPGTDAHEEAVIRAALDAQLERPSGWARLIRARLARTKVASPSPP